MGLPRKRLNSKELIFFVKAGKKCGGEGQQRSPTAQASWGAGGFEP